MLVTGFEFFVDDRANFVSLELHALLLSQKGLESDHPTPHCTVENGASDPNPEPREQTGLGLKGEIHLAPEQSPKAGAKIILLGSAQRCGRSDRHLLSPFGLIHERGERVGDLRQTSGPVLFHKLVEKAI